jgi:putative addiction module killer protein
VLWNISYYKNKYGKEPARDWLFSLRDSVGRSVILIRLKRIEQGNFGDCKSLGDGVNELRISFGPGYRLYFAIDANNALIILLIGGDKSSQGRDIEKAKKYWKESREKTILDR